MPPLAACAADGRRLVPFAIDGTHDGLGQLPELVVEVVHRVRTDPGRLSERWYYSIIAGGLSEESDPSRVLTSSN
jgi:hypothetical protein